MGKKRNEYTKEYKIEAVRLIVEEGRPVSEVSRELGIAQSALHRGNREHQLAHAVRDPNGRAYNRTAHLEERVKMMQQWSDYLDQIKPPSTGLGS